MRAENYSRRGDERQVVVLGAGPGGLTAGWELVHNGVPVDILEADEQKVGGIARTASYKGFRFDIGGHRFFTKSNEVRELWHQILPPEDWLRVRRLSRIYYRGRFFDYPLKPLNALRNLGLVETTMCVASYARARASPRKDERSFEDWVINRFGTRLYRIFFKTYTEKVWGLPTTQISADWAAQRIKGLSLTASIKNALFLRNGPGPSGVIKTLIDQFEYPKLGPGMMWERAAQRIQALGASLHLGTRVESIVAQEGRVIEVTAAGGNGRRLFSGTDFISSIPIRDLVNMLEPTPPPEILQAAAALSYRDFLTVVVIVNKDELFPDNWIYVHEPSVKLGRIQNFKNWSPHMVPDESKTSLGLEYFCYQGDELWEMPDRDLIELASRELAELGLCRAADIEDGTVVRMPKAYPVYDEHYQKHIRTIRRYLETNAANLQLVGRNGMHKYNNQDHSMMTALLAARNLLGENWDPWKVNTDAEYHEESLEGDDTAGRLVPRSVQQPAV